MLLLCHTGTPDSKSHALYGKLQNSEAMHRSTLYLEFFGEVISYYGGEGREEGSQEYTNISDVNSNVEEVQNMVNRC